MADENAQIKLTYDASGAQKGAADFKQASDQVIAAERAVEAASEKAAGTITQNERSKTAVRQAAARAAAAAGQADVQAAALVGNVWSSATQRVATSLTSQQRMLANYARQFDPLGAAVERAQRQLDNLNDVAAKGGPNAERAASLVAAGQQRLANAQKALAEATVGSGAALQQQSRMLDDYARKFNPLGVAVEAAKRDLEELNKVVAEGGQHAGRAASLVPAAQQRVDTSQKALADAGADTGMAEQKKMLDELARAYDPLGTAAEAAKTRVEALQKIMAEGGPEAARATKLLATAQTELAGAQAKAAAGDPKLLAERKALEAEFAPLKTRTDEYNAALVRLQKTVAMGIVTDQQAEVQRKQLTTQFERDKTHIDDAEKGMTKLGHGTAGMSREMLVLSHEMLMGNFNRLGGSLMVMAELAGGVGAALGKVAAFLVTPMGLAIVGIAAVTAAVVGMGVAAERSQRRLMEMRNQLSGFRSDFAPAAEMAQRASQHLGAQTDLGTEGARQMVGAIVTSPQFRGTEAETIRLGKLFNDLGKQMGVDAAKAAEYAKQAFESPSKLAGELGKTLEALDPRFQKHLADLEAEGKKAQASTELLRRLAESVKPVQSNMTELQKEWQKFNKILFDTTNGSHSVVDVVGRAVDHIAASAVRQIGILFEMMKEVVAWIDAHTPDWAKRAVKFMWENGPLDIAKMGVDAVTGGGQPGVAPQGGPVLTDKAGIGVGMFQLEPPAAKDVGLTVAPSGVKPGPENDQRFDYWKNIQGGESYFKKQLETFSGDIDKATRAYNEGAGNIGSAKADKYLADVKAQDPNQLPPSAKADIEMMYHRIFKGIGDEATKQAVVRRLEQIAMKESGGKHFTDAPATTAPASIEPAPGSIIDAPNEASQQALEEYKNVPAISRQLDENRQAIKRTTAGLIEDSKALDKARHDQHTEAAKLAQEAVTRDQETLRLLQAQRTDILTPGQRAVREKTEALQPLSAEPGAARQFAELELQQRQRDRQSPYGNAADNARERAALQAKLTADLDDTTRAMDQQIAAQQRLIPMYEAGGQAAEHLANVEKARIEALKYAVRGTDEYRAALARLTAEYDRNSQVTRDTQAAQNIARMKQETEQLQLQLALVTATNAERDRKTAVLQQRQQLGLGPTDTVSPEQQKAINLAGQNAALRTQAQQTKAAYAELEQTGDRIFDTFEKAMTEPLRQGETAAQRFGSMMVSVLTDIEKELLKLAVINPLKNALFGGEHRPEIGDVGGLLGGGKGGLFGKLFGLGGGGTGTISSDAGGGAGIANRQFDAALGKQLMDATGGTGIISHAPGGTWNVVPTPGTAPAAAPAVVMPTNQNAVVAPGGGNYSTDNPTMKALTPEQLIQQEHDQHERSMGGQRSDIGSPSTVDVAANSGNPSFDPTGIAATSVGDNLTLAYNEFLKKPAAPGANDNAVLASSTDKLVSSLGDQVSTIKDQVGSINSLVDTGQNQVGAIGNLVTSLGAGGCGCGGGPGGGQGGGQGGGGILGSLFSKVGGMFGGSGTGAGGDGMASGGDLSALSTEASSNVSAGAAGLHAGGLVGYDPPSFTRLVDPAMFANAPRLHAGLGADEFAAILQKGERVLTGQQQKQVHAAANNNGGGGHSFTFNFPADASPDGFRRAGAQVATQVQSSLARAKARNTI